MCCNSRSGLVISRSHLRLGHRCSFLWLCWVLVDLDAFCLNHGSSVQLATWLALVKPLSTYYGLLTFVISLLLGNEIRFACGGEKTT